MIEYMWENRPISHAEEFQAIDLGNCALKEVEYNSLFLKNELHMMTSFQKKYNNMGKEKKSNLTVE